ncbi:hypothetical protein [Streptomyces noursei]|uniref:Uncharacterized protein n=1 Tax=Streptomyces noursei TaxID=1971 RepID=A0A2N8PR35_STRNR|nr:hypothetical protein [Streptomyces noursei]PNE43482.1 hypothetical protein AOB60_00760 [Streptomyces noursei]
MNHRPNRRLTGVVTAPLAQQVPIPTRSYRSTEMRLLAKSVLGDDQAWHPPTAKEARVMLEKLAGYAAPRHDELVELRCRLPAGSQLQPYVVVILREARRRLTAGAPHPSLGAAIKRAENHRVGTGARERIQ